MLTHPTHKPTITAEHQTSLSAETATVMRGFYLPPLWRESGSSNARGCPITVLSSRHLGGLKAFLVAFFNALSEGPEHAQTTPRHSHNQAPAQPNPRSPTLAPQAAGG